MLFLICIQKMSMDMSTKEFMADLNTLKPEHQLLTIETNIMKYLIYLKNLLKVIL